MKLNLVKEYIQVRGNSEAKEILEDYMEYLCRQRYFVVRERSKIRVKRHAE